MADKIKYGGPAFPLENPRFLEDGDLFKQFPGMSLQDWFAGQALIGIVAGSAVFGDDKGAQAREAYDYADALLAERGGQNG